MRSSFLTLQRGDAVRDVPRHTTCAAPLSPSTPHAHAAHNSSPPIQSLCHTVCLITVRPLHRWLRPARFWCCACSGGECHSCWRTTLTGWHKSCAAQLPFRLAGGTPCRFILPCTMSRTIATTARSNWVLRSFACARPPIAAHACCRIR
ncbi:DUF1534 domain-containing protein [Pseudomonas syringae]|nr:DUF1534 domain-containing protein [Pseudomonas syringae]MCF5737788.1 DUF1534 domain-containing protein [Pseudomonas syringae]MCF5749189.1 DUF1534 domain-containing protein [Pseudomonas syringae]MCF5754023.1 DUF1534 domain-containing protein [Pseudomonas syringae]